MDLMQIFQIFGAVAWVIFAIVCQNKADELKNRAPTQVVQEKRNWARSALVCANIWIASLFIGG